MHPHIKLIAICAFMLFPASAQDLAAELAPLAEAHQTATAALADQRAAELVKLRQPYLLALDDADQAATKAGDINTLRAITQQRKAVNSGMLVEDLPKALPRKLSPIHRALIASESRAHTHFDKKQKELDAEYLKQLGVLQTRNPELAEQISKEKMRVISGISGPVSDLNSDLVGTKWRLTVGEGTKVFHFKEGGHANVWKYEVIANDKVRIHFNKKTGMTLSLDKSGTSLTDGKRTWALIRD